MINILKYIINKTRVSKLAQINRKGQADVVFEVLIAVILLGFVLFTGTMAMSSLSNTKCSKSIDISLGDLRLTLEKAAASTLLSTEYLFNMPYCFGGDFNVALQKQTNAALCSAYCPGSSGQCYLLKYDNRKDKVNQVRYTCVQISSIVEVNTDVAGCVVPRITSTTTDTYEPAPNSSLNGGGTSFESGRYIINSKNLSSGRSVPILCIFKKVVQ